MIPVNSEFIGSLFYEVRYASGQRSENGTDPQDFDFKGYAVCDAESQPLAFPEGEFFLSSNKPFVGLLHIPDEGLVFLTLDRVRCLFVHAASPWLVFGAQL